EELGIVGYTNQEMAEEADKNTRVGVKKFWFTGKRLPLFPNISLQQLHEIFVKKSASDNQCPCLESKVKQGKLSQIYIHHSK
ncbi:16600_t:CDS:2, partial [Dentiscutata erythropus]